MHYVEEESPIFKKEASGDRHNLEFYLQLLPRCIACTLQGSRPKRLRKTASRPFEQATGYPAAKYQVDAASNTT